MDKKTIKEKMRIAKKAGFRHIRYNKELGSIIFNDDIDIYVYDGIQLLKYDPRFRRFYYVEKRLEEIFQKPLTNKKKYDLLK